MDKCLTVANMQVAFTLQSLAGLHKEQSRLTRNYHNLISY